MAIGALNQASFVLSRLDVNKDSMTINLYSTKDLIVGEAVMMGLAPFVGHDVKV
ncbi:Ff.00g100870.m01.CDS01 [Fusarium sp. VM40]|nr:Ff.00g100870.m01.CDS01 [Fusarium sp. VM40]